MREIIAQVGAVNIIRHEKINNRHILDKLNAGGVVQGQKCRVAAKGRCPRKPKICVAAVRVKRLLAGNNGQNFLFPQIRIVVKLDLLARRARIGNGQIDIYTPYIFKWYELHKKKKVGPALCNIGQTPAGESLVDCGNILSQNTTHEAHHARIDRNGRNALGKRHLELMFFRTNQGNIGLNRELGKRIALVFVLS